MFCFVSSAVRASLTALVYSTDRSNACHVSDDWPLRPQFNLRLRQRHGVVLWIMAFFFYFRVQHADQPTLLDYTDFMRRARWKERSLPQRLQRVRNYLSVL